MLAYLARGGYFGEIALLSGSPRSATCTALDHVEVVRISGEDFNSCSTAFLTFAKSWRSSPKNELKKICATRFKHKMFPSTISGSGTDGGTEPSRTGS